MSEFLTAIAAGICVGAWNRFLLQGGWRACLIPEQKEEIEHTDDSSTSSTISLDVHAH